MIDFVAYAFLAHIQAGYSHCRFSHLFIPCYQQHTSQKRQLDARFTFFSAKYSAFIYCNVQYTIAISLREYLIQNFEDAILLPKTLTDIIKRFTNTYFINIVPFISSHLLFLRLFTFGIHKRMSHPPSIIILDKKIALI